MDEATRRIRKLPSHVIDMIKAGEVIERPSSVVKELFENAVDGGATDVHVELLDGGRALVRVTDNGSGIPPEDVPVALERHATSKLETPDDLLEIGTFGFRGEALASIAAVGKLTLRSRVAGEDLGVEIEVNEGRASAPRRVAAPVGTSVALKDLFSSVPARQKFLKSTATEFSHVQDYLLAMALAYPRVGVRLSHNAREVFRYGAAADLKGRFEQMQRELAREFVPFRYERGRFGVEGFAGLPEGARPVPRLFLTFVNGRLVRDKVVRAGVLQAYSGLVLKGLLPSALVFVTVDPATVDVNAHPAKTEIRFQDPLMVEDLVTIAIQGALKEHVTKKMLVASDVAPVPLSAHESRPAHAQAHAQGMRGDSEREAARRAGWGGGAEGRGPIGKETGDKETGRNYASLSALSRFGASTSSTSATSSATSRVLASSPVPVRRPVPETSQGTSSTPPPPDLFAARNDDDTSPEGADALTAQVRSVDSRGGPDVGSAHEPVGARVPPPSGEDASVEADLSPRETRLVAQVRPGAASRPSALAEARYLGQFRNCYLLFESGPDLLVVDQHALHERILYEELAQAATASAGVPRQEMLTPILLPGPRTVALLVRESDEAFRKLGFRVEAMEEGTLALHAFPAFLPVARAAEVFEEVLARVVALSDLPESDVHPLLLRARGARAEFAALGVHERNLEARSVYHMLHATMACHAAVRAGDPLGEELVRRLVARSADVDFFAHCPHGRPVYRRFTDKDVGEWFLRI